MTQSLSQSHFAINEWLGTVASDVRQLSERRWQFTLPDGPRVSASADDVFLQFDAPAPMACELALVPQWLRWHAALAGNAKLALVPGPWRLRLRAEIPLLDGENTSARIGEVVQGLSLASQLLFDMQSVAGGSQKIGTADAKPRRESRRLFEMLHELGRSFQERTDGAATLELGSRGECFRVSLVEDSDGIRVAVEFLRADSLPPDAHLAICELLLCAGGTLRLARPFAADLDGQFACGFEVRFAGETTAGELEHALEALTVACWACNAEVQSLLNNSVVASYMTTANIPPILPREEF